MNRFNLLLLFFVSLTTHSQVSWVMQETQRDDVWTIKGSPRDLTSASVNGQITHKDRLRIFFDTSDRCEHAWLSTTFYTPYAEPDIRNLEDVEITLEAFGGEIDAEIETVVQIDSGAHVAWISLLLTDAVEMKHMLEVMNDEYDEIEITILSNSQFKADKYFDIATNRWSLNGSLDAYDRARLLCIRTAEDTLL